MQPQGMALVRESPGRRARAKRFRSYIPKHNLVGILVFSNLHPAGGPQIRERPGEGGLVLCHSSAPTAGAQPQSGGRGLVELTRFRDDLVSGEGGVEAQVLGLGWDRSGVASWSSLAFITTRSQASGLGRRERAGMVDWCKVTAAAPLKPCRQCSLPPESYHF